MTYSTISAGGQLLDRPSTNMPRMAALDDVQRDQHRDHGRGHGRRAGVRCLSANMPCMPVLDDVQLDQRKPRFNE